MYEKYLKHVKNYLTDHNGDVPSEHLMAFRYKYQHIIRVLDWAKRLAERKMLV